MPDRRTTVWPRAPSKCACRAGAATIVPGCSTLVFVVSRISPWPKSRVPRGQDCGSAQRARDRRRRCAHWRRAIAIEDRPGVSPALSDASRHGDVFAFLDGGRRPTAGYPDLVIRATLQREVPGELNLHRSQRELDIGTPIGERPAKGLGDLLFPALNRRVVDHSNGVAHIWLLERGGVAVVVSAHELRAQSVERVADSTFLRP